MLASSNELNRMRGPVLTHCRSSVNDQTWFRSIVTLFFLAGSLLVSQTARGQGGGLGGGLGGFEPAVSYPNDAYYTALLVYRDGDLERAVDLFDTANRRTRKDINGQWIDAIPVYAMLAECYWHLGDMAAVRQSVDSAFQLAIRYRGWLARPIWEDGAEHQRPSCPPGWPLAGSDRSQSLADFEVACNFAPGQRLTEQRSRTPTVAFEEANIKVIDIAEVMRGLATASYRRRMLMGPLSDQDSLTTELIDASKYPAGLQLPIARNLIGAMRAAEKFSGLKDTDAVQDAAGSAMFNGGVHPLTPVTLMCQASALAASEQPAVAVPIAANVAHTAASLEQYEWVGEAMQLAAGCAATPEQAESVRQIATTAATALLRKSRLGTLHCLIAAADAAVTAGQLDAAATLLAQAQSLSTRRDVFQPRLDAYGAFVAARLAAAQGSSAGLAAASDLDNAMTLMKSFALERKNRNRPLISMPRIYQLELVRMAAGRNLGGQSSDKLLEHYCDEPPDVLWRRDPVDALSSVMVNRTSAFAARLDLAAARSDGESVLMRADDLLDYRFCSRLPMGGRLLQVRSFVRSSDSLLDPKVAELRGKAPKIVKDLRKDVLAPAPADTKAIQMRAAKLEADTAAVALSRFNMPRTMPPPLNEKTDLKRIPDRKALLTFIYSGNKIYVTLAANAKVNMWVISGASRVSSEIGRVLRGIGVGNARGKRLPDDSSWRAEAVKLRRHLIPDDETITPESFDELVIVPDGPLWYLPFELLPFGEADSPLWADKLQIRYAATPGLAFRPTGIPATSRVLGVVADKFFAPRDPEANESIVQSIADAVTDAVRIPEKLNLPTSLLGESVGHLLVAAPVTPNMKAPLAVGIAPYDRTLPEGSLAAWLRFPAKVPASVILPGFRSAVEVGQVGSGDELFSIVCGLQSAGVRSVLVSRWIVGGNSTSLALSEFVQELPFTGMVKSWQRARMILRQSEIDPTAEPLLTQADHDREGITGDEPFFWAGYLVAAPLSQAELAHPDPFHLKGLGFTVHRAKIGARFTGLRPSATNHLASIGLTYQQSTLMRKAAPRQLTQATYSASSGKTLSSRSMRRMMERRRMMKSLL